MLLFHSFWNKSEKKKNNPKTPNPTVFAHNNTFKQNIKVVNFFSEFVDQTRRYFLSFYSAYKEMWLLRFIRNKSASITSYNNFQTYGIVHK